ncbi:MAG: hypothetical protein ACP5VF_11930 [Acidobacteriota bacterium]
MRLSEGELERLTTVARQLEPLHTKSVFLGGAIVGLLVTDPAGAEVRPTKDVDVVVEVATYFEYTEIEARLWDLGFLLDQEEGAPLCRWLVEGIKVDIMPPDTSVIGFSNPWYPEAVRTAQPFQLGIGLSIHLINAPCFLATKLAAFSSRGRGDYLRSPDIEDVVIVLDGRPEMGDEIASSPSALREFLASESRALLETPALLRALVGHLDPDEASQAREGLILRRLRHIADMKG